MNLRDLFEKKVDDHEEEQEIEIRDPATKWLINKARARYAYAETDLEAFVKFMQDEVHAERENIKHNTDDIEHNADDIEHEAEVNVSQQQEIDSTEKSTQNAQVINNRQEKHLSRLDSKEQEIDDTFVRFTNKEKEIDATLEKYRTDIEAKRRDIEMKIDKLDAATMKHTEMVQIGN